MKTEVAKEASQTLISLFSIS